MAELVWKAARKQAEETLNHYWDKKYPVKVVSISKKMGVVPYRAELPKGVSGMIIKKPRNDAKSYVAVCDIEPRRRFTLAHELGHYVERTVISKDDDFSFVEPDADSDNDGEYQFLRSKKYDLHEFFADEFAGALLMPADDFLHKLKVEGSIATAAYFGVSLSAVQKRKERLDKHA